MRATAVQPAAPYADAGPHTREFVIPEPAQGHAGFEPLEGIDPATGEFRLRPEARAHSGTRCDQRQP